MEEFSKATFKESLMVFWLISGQTNRLPGIAMGDTLCRRCLETGRRSCTQTGLQKKVAFGFAVILITVLLSAIITKGEKTGQ